MLVAIQSICVAGGKQTWPRFRPPSHPAVLWRDWCDKELAASVPSRHFNALSLKLPVNLDAGDAWQKAVLLHDFCGDCWANYMQLAPGSASSLQKDVNRETGLWIFGFCQLHYFTDNFVDGYFLFLSDYGCMYRHHPSSWNLQKTSAFCGCYDFLWPLKHPL